MITSLDLARSGDRLLSGGMDSTVRFCNFAGMDETLKSFRQIEPRRGQSAPVNCLAYNKRGSFFFVCDSSARPKIYDREGHKVTEFIKGDMYLRDLTHTS